MYNKYYKELGPYAIHNGQVPIRLYCLASNHSSMVAASEWDRCKDVIASETAKPEEKRAAQDRLDKWFRGMKEAPLRTITVYKLSDLVL